MHVTSGNDHSDIIYLSGIYCLIASVFKVLLGSISCTPLSTRVCAGARDAEKNKTRSFLQRIRRGLSEHLTCSKVHYTSLNIWLKYTHACVYMHFLYTGSQCEAHFLLWKICLKNTLIEQNRHALKAIKCIGSTADIYGRCVKETDRGGTKQDFIGRDL